MTFITQLRNVELKTLNNNRHLLVLIRSLITIQMIVSISIYINLFDLLRNNVTILNLIGIFYLI